MAVNQLPVKKKNSERGEFVDGKTALWDTVDDCLSVYYLIPEHSLHAGETVFFLSILLTIRFLLIMLRDSTLWIKVKESWLCI